MLLGHFDLGQVSSPYDPYWSRFEMSTERAVAFVFSDIAAGWSSSLLFFFFCSSWCSLVVNITGWSGSQLRSGQTLEDAFLSMRCIDILWRPLVTGSRASGAKNPKIQGLGLTIVYRNNVLTKYFIHGFYEYQSKRNHGNDWHGSSLYSYAQKIHQVLQSNLCSSS